MLFTERLVQKFLSGQKYLMREEEIYGVNFISFCACARVRGVVFRGIGRRSMQRDANQRFSKSETEQGTYETVAFQG